MSKADIGLVTMNVNMAFKDGTAPSVEQIQDAVEKELANQGFFEVSKSYILYREKHRIQREATDHLMEQYHDLLFVDAEEVNDKRENANINTNTPMGTMLKIGTEASKVYTRNYLLPEEFKNMHDEEWVHINDLDFANICWNCLTQDLSKLFEGGFNTGHGYIREPQSIRAYASLACIAIQSSQNDMLGGFMAS